MAHQAEREEIEHKKFIDYKDVAYLKLFTNPHAKMLPRRRTGVTSKRQREVSTAIKRARYMALLPYVEA